MNRKDIGKLCASKRKVTKYKQSKESGLTIGQIERIEEGKKNYTLDLLIKYLPSLNLSIHIK